MLWGFVQGRDEGEQRRDQYAAGRNFSQVFVGLRLRMRKQVGIVGQRGGIPAVAQYGHPQATYHLRKPVPDVRVRMAHLGGEYQEQADLDGLVVNQRQEQGRIVQDQTEATRDVPAQSRDLLFIEVTTAKSS